MLTCPVIPNFFECTAIGWIRSWCRGSKSSTESPSQSPGLNSGRTLWLLAEQSSWKSRVQSTNSRPFDENCKFTNFTLITKHESRTAWSCRGPILIPILWQPSGPQFPPFPLSIYTPYPPALGHSLLLHNHHLHRLGLLPPLFLFLVTRFWVSKSLVSLCVSYLTLLALWNLIIYIVD